MLTSRQAWRIAAAYGALADAYYDASMRRAWASFDKTYKTWLAKAEAIEKTEKETGQ